MSRPMSKRASACGCWRKRRITVPLLVEDGKVIQVGWQGRGCVVNAK